VSNRERVIAISEELQSGEVLPAAARNYLMAATGLLGAFVQEHRLAERAYRHVLYGCQQVEKVAARAKVASEVTPQYDEMVAAKDAVAYCEQVIMSLKVFLRSLDNEMQLSR
jgi:hypothetical protein